MVRQYGSFLLRCWTIDGREQRVEVEHVQSGAQSRFDSLDAAFTWIMARTGADSNIVETKAAEEQPVGISLVGEVKEV
jgi:hypothetical protein